MPNPFSQLQPALKALCTEAEVLPATGQAVVDLVMPDLDEIYDRVTGGSPIVEKIWETDTKKLYRDLIPKLRSEEHYLRYFLDGSAKTYFIGTVLEQDRSSPVQIAQVGTAAVYRLDDGQIRKASVQREIALMVDKKSLSDELWAELEQTLKGLDGFKLLDTAERNPYADAMGLKEPRPRGAHKANGRMRELELETARSLPRGQEEWLVLDGSLGNEFENWKGNPLLSINKSFRRDTRIQLGKSLKLNLYSLLKGLKRENQRTIVFPRSPKENGEGTSDGDREGKIVFWYVRMRPQEQLDYPLMGVVKVEMPNPNQEPVDSALIDRISGWIVAERSVTAYGSDSRWHAHLYPIYIAERVIRGQFYSEEVLKAGIRWPL